MEGKVVDIDGSVMEGGGQILRISAALSILLKQPIRVYNIRAGRSKPGLRPQHLAGLQLVAELCSGKLLGGHEGSTEITLYPGQVKNGQYSADPGTAGSITLLFQVAFPCLIFASGPTELRLKGGTNVEMAPQIDYVLMILKPIMEKFGVKFDCEIIRRGYYPKGGGEVVLRISPVQRCLSAIEITDRGAVDKISGLSFVSGSSLNFKLAHIMADIVKEILRPHFVAVSLHIDRQKFSPAESFGNGSGIIAVASTQNGCYLACSGLGGRNVRAEQVGPAVGNSLLEQLASGACVDSNLQDQLIIFMTLAQGKSRIRCGKVTLHTETAIYIAEKLTKAKFTIHKCDELGEENIIECEGIGLCR